MMKIEALDAVFAAPLNGKVAVWPVDWLDEPSLETAQRRLFYHGIGGLLNARRDLLQRWPESLLKAMHEESLGRTMWEMRHKMLIAEAIEALHRAGIVSVLLKGTALAYQYYADPALRFRGDTDLLISSHDLACSRMLFAQLGWQLPTPTNGPFGDLHYQELWRFKDAAGLTHNIDLHWEVTNSMALRTVLDCGALLNSSQSLTALSSSARCAEPVTALIHRAINRAEHGRSGYFSLDQDEYDPDRLIWAVDIDCLAKDLDSNQWEALANRSINKRQRIL